MAISKKREYVIGGVAKVWSNVKVTAGSMAEALELSKGLDASDFIESNDVNDSSFKIVQVYDPDFEINDI